MIGKLDTQLSPLAASILVVVLIALAIDQQKRLPSLDELRRLQRDPQQIPLLTIFSLNKDRFTEEGMKAIEKMFQKTRRALLILAATILILDFFTS